VGTWQVGSINVGGPMFLVFTSAIREPFGSYAISILIWLPWFMFVHPNYLCILIYPHFFRKIFVYWFQKKPIMHNIG